MVADSELGVKLVPDESALENIEERQLEIAGEPDSVEDAKEQNEEQTNQLNIVSRKLGRISGTLGKVAVIATILAGIAKILGSVFDIGFEDVRNAIVTALNNIKDNLLQTLGVGGGGTSSASTGQSIRRGVGQNLALAGTPFGGLPLLSSLDLESLGQSTQDQLENIDISVLTSRDQLSGDSTQQEQNSENINFFDFEGGS